MELIEYTKDNILNHIKHDNFEWDLVKGFFACFACNVKSKIATRADKGGWEVMEKKEQNLKGKVEIWSHEKKKWEKTNDSFEDFLRKKIKEIEK